MKDSATVRESAAAFDPTGIGVKSDAETRLFILQVVSLSYKSSPYKRIVAACPFVPGALEWTMVPRMIASGATAP